MKIDISNLMTVRNYAVKEHVTVQYIYKLIKQGRMQSLLIDGVQFVNVKDYPVLPVVNRR